MKNSGFGGLVAGQRSKWVTLLVWIAIVVLLNMVWPSVNSQENNNAGDLPAEAASVQASMLQEAEFPSGSGIPALLVWHREGGLNNEDLSGIQSLYESWESSPVPYQEFVPPYHKMPLPALMGQLSEDQTTMVTPIIFSKEADSDQLKEGVEEVQKGVVEQMGSDPFAVSYKDSSALSARVTGPAGISIDAAGLFKNADFQLLLATVLLVLVILLLIYRSPILALIPLVAVGFAYGATSPVLGFMAEKDWITIDAQAISIMTVLLFGAGTDYCLFIISRFRQVLRTEESKTKALLRAISDSGGAIAMSGFTVVIALLALLFAKYGVYHRFAAPFSISIFIMFIASLTLVPALLAIFGRVSFFPVIPRTPEMEEERARKKGKPAPVRKPKKNSFNGRVVVNKPWAVVIITAVLLGSLAVFSTQVKFTYDLLSTFPEDMPSREGFTQIGEKFSPGELAPVKLMVDSEGQELGLGDKLAELPYVDLVSEPLNGQNNANLIAYDIELNVNPYSLEAMDHIADLRAVAAQQLEGAGIQAAGDKVWIGGQTAEQVDTKEISDRDTRVIIPIVTGMITVLLLLYLRSIVATAYLVVTVVVSFFSALGLGWIILHYGLGIEAIQGVIPLYSFVFLVALGEDYNIFMISSIWKKRRVMPLKQAIKEGVEQTGSVITSAGLILAGTFAVLGTLPIQALVQFGVITAVGVLLDTFIVRPYLVPALTTLCGKWAFWPGKHVEVKEETTKTSLKSGH